MNAYNRPIRQVHVVARVLSVEKAAKSRVYSRR